MNAIDKLAITGGHIGLEGWHYDIVVDRLERKGYRKKSRIPFPLESGVEGHVYVNDSGTVFHVITHRIDGHTWVAATPGKSNN